MARYVMCFFGVLLILPGIALIAEGAYLAYQAYVQPKLSGGVPTIGGAISGDCVFFIGTYGPFEGYWIILGMGVIGLFLAGAGAACCFHRNERNAPKSDGERE